MDLTPASARPYVSDRGTDSELSLILGYNGLGRVTQALASHLSFLHLPIVPGFAPGIGDPGLSRLVANGTVRFFYLPSRGANGVGGPGEPGGVQGEGQRGPFGQGSQRQAGAVANTLARTNNDLTTWVQGHCTAVPTTAWRSSTSSTGSSGPTAAGRAGGMQLYDCAGASHT